MAVPATLIRDDRHITIDICDDASREAIEDDSELEDFAPGTITWIYWDAEKLKQGERVLLGLEVLDITRVHDDDLALLNRATLPRVDIIDGERLLNNVALADVLRHARDSPTKAYENSPHEMLEPRSSA